MVARSRARRRRDAALWLARLGEEAYALYAVFESGGKQYKVSEGDVVFLEKLGSEVGEDVEFGKVLACSNEGEVAFGTPYLEGASVGAKVISHGKDKKIIVFKYKAKKGYRKKQGHRQPHTKVRIETINAAGAIASASPVAAAAPAEIESAGSGADS
jgi:large subunit ribosomal protein L21